MLAAHSLYAGLDVGTSKVGLAIQNAAGINLVRDSEPLGRPALTSTGQTVQRPTDWVRAARTLFDRAARLVRLDAVAALGVTATTPTLVFVDGRGRPIHNEAILWCDTQRRGRATPLNAGLQKLAAALALDTELRHRTVSVLDAGNYLCYALTGERTAGAAALSQKFAWTPETGYDARGFARGLTDLLPERVVATGEAVGTLRPRAAARLGLPPGMRVVFAGYDSVASLPGAAICRAGETLLLTVGTSVGLYLAPALRSGAALGPWALRSHLLPHGLRTVAGGFEAGLQSIALLHARLRLTCAAARTGSGLEALVADAERREGAGCFALPFGGVPLRSPLPGVVLPTAIYSEREFVPSEAASLVALRRGVAYFVRYALDDLRARGVAVRRIHIVGGGTKSPSFCRLVADACRLPVLSYGAHAAADGAAALAATAGFDRADWERRIGTLAAEAAYEPATATRVLYADGYARFAACLGVALRQSA